jgi:hypothetical protein
MHFHEITHVSFCVGYFPEILHNMIHFERLTEVFKMVRSNFFFSKNILLQFDRNLTWHKKIPNAKFHCANIHKKNLLIKAQRWKIRSVIQWFKNNFILLQINRENLNFKKPLNFEFQITLEFEFWEAVKSEFYLNLRLSLNSNFKQSSYTFLKIKIEIKCQ